VLRNREEKQGLLLKGGREEKKGSTSLKKKERKGKAPFFLFLCGEFYVKNKVKKGWRE